MKNNTRLKGNAAQMLAIKHVNGPALVVAGPGSGKTFVIIERIRYLIESAGIDPSNILVITFTKAAAIEMQQRFFKLTDSGYPEVAFGTFHSIFYNILKLSGNAYDIRLISEIEKYKILENILKGIKSKIPLNSSFSEDYEINGDVIKNILSEISRIKNEGTGPKDCNESIAFSKYFEEIFSEYHAQMRELGKIDFDDMISKCYQMLLKQKSELDKWQERFKYILVDEAQDINNAQWQLIDLLSEKYRNLFMVGDDDQSIYGFRGSKPEILIDFEKIIPECKKIFLDVNYRCAPKILLDSLKVIEDNNIRIKKNIKAGSDYDGQIDYSSFYDFESEIKAITSFINNQKDTSNIAILFRTNNQAAKYTQTLMGLGVECYVKEKVKSFYEEECIKDMLAYLKFVYLGGRRKDFLRIMNKPVRYIKREAIPGDIVNKNDLFKYYAGNFNMQDKLQRFFKDLDRLRNFRPYLSVKYIRNVMGYDKYLRENKTEKNPERSIELLNEFEKEIREYDDMRLFTEHVSKVNESLHNQQSTVKTTTQKGVRLMTLHASKGLEFDYVWIPDVNEGIIPSRRSVTIAEMEEERRMFYVGMTRAKKELHISYLTGSRDNQMLPSRFIKKFIRKNISL
ncbi:MAG: ATP-dependent helicase [Butyrivibrio sp.]|nr:ATP-dependent helicase [Butyrivibrio sp.]